ncbi:DUF4126 domain-containing protein [Cryptosporangium phraense]|uniref:DUF4126 domain-containing protein n=1 Tax=Cryptosporangium phraense TaxID=2593070 RepID=A0A545ARX3_9ACTN|nr:DUF4126 domain-containing protein [Cryptosporangium phraense]TQS44064.1 DUF4126 domain-containing protein [Cryptosporangium phraense]
MVVLRSFVVGVVTGGRSMTGLAAAAGSGGDGLPKPLAWLAGGGRRAVLLGALGEIVADKLPGTPSRLAPPALAGRVVVGAVAGLLVASRAGRNPVVPVLVAGAGAVAGSVAGARWRAYAADRGWPAVPAALAEDLAVVTLAATVRR